MNYFQSHTEHITAISIYIQLALNYYIDINVAIVALTL